MAIEMVPQACPAGLAAGHPQFTRWSSSAGHPATFFGEHSGYRLRWARRGLFEIEHPRWLLPPPTRLGLWGIVFHGLTPTAKCGRRLRGLTGTRGLAPGTVYPIIDGPTLCRDSGSAANYWPRSETHCLSKSARAYAWGYPLPPLRGLTGTPGLAPGRLLA